MIRKSKAYESHRVGLPTVVLEPFGDHENGVNPKPFIILLGRDVVQVVPKESESDSGQEWLRSSNSRQRLTFAEAYVADERTPLLPRSFGQPEPCFLIPDCPSNSKLLGFHRLGGCMLHAPALVVE